MLLNSEKDINVLKNCYILNLIKMRYSKIESCNLAGFSRIKLVLFRWSCAEGGYNALIPNYGGGHNPKLSDEQLNDLKIKLPKKDSWLVDEC